MRYFSGQDPLDHKEITTLFTAEDLPFRLSVKKKMRLKLDLNNDEVISMIVQFWEKRRVRFEEISSNALHGRRGSLWWNLVAFDPNKLKTDLMILLSHEKRSVECLMVVNTRFQHITSTSRDYYEMEMNAFSAYLRRGEDYKEKWRVFNDVYRKDRLRWIVTYVKAVLIIAALSGAFELLMWMLRQ
jgi:hypothetical protein